MLKWWFEYDQGTITCTERNPTSLTLRYVPTLRCGVEVVHHCSQVYLRLCPHGL